MTKSLLTVVAIFAVAVAYIPANAQEPAWRTVAEWKGAGDKKTEIFTIKASEWRVRWERTVVGYLFTISVYRPGQERPVASGTYLNNQHTNTITVRGSGEFYLVISAGLAPAVWTVAAQEPETGREGGY